MNPLTEPIELRGTHASLRAAAAGARRLRWPRRAATASCGGSGTPPCPAPSAWRAEIERRLALHAAGSMLPFTVLDASGAPVGMTTFMNIDATHRRVEIGSTWYAVAGAAHARSTPSAS